MRHRFTLVLVVGLALAAAGCMGALDAGEQLEAADTNGTSDNGTEQRASPANQTETAPPSNGTEEENSVNETGPADGNETAEQDDDADDGPAFGNLTMTDASRERPNASAIVFTWSGEAGFSGQNTTFEVPSSAPFVANASLTWEADADLNLVLASPEVSTLCSVGRPPTIPPSPSVDQATCEVPSLAQPEGSAWRATVQRTDAESSRGPGDMPVAFTLTLELRALPDAVADAGPSLAPDGNPPVVSEWPSLEEATIRPGIRVATGCTGNFVFSTPLNGTLYMGTAAHCVQTRPGQPPVHLGDEVPFDGGAFTGRVAYCSWGAAEDLLTCPDKDGVDEGYSDDFALIELPAEARAEVHPAMRVWGGPTEVAEPPSQGTRVFTYGASPLRDGGADANVGDSRTGIVTSEDDTRTHALFGPTSINGDSGSPTITADGAALGTVATIGTAAQDPPGSNGIVNLDASLTNFQEHTGRAVHLKTWSLFDVPRAEPLPSPTGP